MAVFVTDVNVVGAAFTMAWKVSGGVSRTLLDVAAAHAAGGDVPVAPTENVIVPNVAVVETPVHVHVNVKSTSATAGALGGLAVHVGVLVPVPVLLIVSVPGVTVPTATLDVRVCFNVIVAGLPAEPVTSTGASSVFVFVASWVGGTQASLLPALPMLLSVVARVVPHVFVATLYVQKTFVAAPLSAHTDVPSVVSAPPAPKLAGAFFRLLHFPVTRFGTNLETWFDPPTTE
jgi:hypothetical protein